MQLSQVNETQNCYKYGRNFRPNRLQSCPAKDKVCSKSAKRGHFAKVCRSTKYVDQITFKSQTEINRRPRVAYTISFQQTIGETTLETILL